MRMQVLLLLLLRRRRRQVPQWQAQQRSTWARRQVLGRTLHEDQRVMHRYIIS